MADRDRGFDLEGRAAVEESKRRGQLSPVDRVAERGYFASASGGNLPVLESEELLVFGSDNYLGLTDDQRVQNAVRQAAAAVGTGAGASRLRTGDTLLHHDLERQLAETEGTDRALAFPSRYAAAAGVLTTLEPDVVFVDEATHPSVVDGCRLADAELVTYDHCDSESLRSALEARAAEGTATESWLVATNTVFDVDGTVAPLAAICTSAAEFGAWVAVDETHATGLYAGGGGVVQAEGLEEHIHVQFGSLGTALASQGGYVAGSDALVDCLLQELRLFDASVGLAPTAAAAASEALHRARHGDARERIWENVAHLQDGLRTMGLDVLGESQILTVRVGDESDAVALADGLRERGIVAPAVAPPFASDEEWRLRVTPMATHESDDVVDCLESLQAAGEEIGLL
ncbi:aminotransferase class I/II-fold pyridoxal phosphate-dependent enzyme [Halobiforma nitratireducens]|uniref:8-amino-7-oxononanoate synthase n=1 Tax=Halobiforma nitratireducens JCM 10879 TaxID=1227454 RepID=M0MP45_9EURY|nr:aminotransferase class I/II-fold pyridoxal phosphate-dependent enzyme [Halobiforma nitratireducens]EMA46230.1 8-amino-7-oxononanoate synthase [Halobiforma nitratireducens JCM 10879]